MKASPIAKIVTSFSLSCSLLLLSIPNVYAGPVSKTVERTRRPQKTNSPKQVSAHRVVRQSQNNGALRLRRESRPTQSGIDNIQSPVSSKTRLTQTFGVHEPARSRVDRLVRQEHERRNNTALLWNMAGDVAQMERKAGKETTSQDVVTDAIKKAYGSK